MKKIVAIMLMAIILVVPCALSANAAEPAINTAEQSVLDALSSTVTVNGRSYAIPAQYVNQAKNYFTTIEMTEAQASAIIAQINIAKAEVQTNATPSTLQLKDLPSAAKQRIITAGQAAAATVNLTLVYNAARDEVIITKNPTTAGETPTVLFTDSPVIKTTGADVNTVAVSITVFAVVCALVACAVISKKARLF